MAFRHLHNGNDVRMRKMQSTASVTIAVGDLLSLTTAGRVQRSAANDASIVGIAQEAKASTDTATTPVLVAIIQPADEILADATVTSPAQTDIGEEIDIVDHASVDVGASSNDECIVTRLYGTATDKVVVHFNPDYLFTGTGTI